MSHDQSFAGRSAAEEAHSKCLQMMLCREAEWPAEKLRFGARRGLGSRKKRNLKRPGDRDVSSRQAGEDGALSLAMEARARPRARCLCAWAGSWLKGCVEPVGKLSGWEGRTSS